MYGPMVDLHYDLLTLTFDLLTSKQHCGLRLPRGTCLPNWRFLWPTVPESQTWMGQTDMWTECNA